MNYSQFLYSQLFMNYVENNITQYKELEYDLIFPAMEGHRNTSLGSVYNTDDKGEYQCIIEYLTNELI